MSIFLLIYRYNFDKWIYLLLLWRYCAMIIYKMIEIELKNWSNKFYIITIYNHFVAVRLFPSHLCCNFIFYFFLEMSNNLNLLNCPSRPVHWIICSICPDSQLLIMTVNKTLLWHSSNDYQQVVTDCESFWWLFLVVHPIFEN